jgi:FkbM family methyltransferase
MAIRKFIDSLQRGFKRGASAGSEVARDQPIMSDMFIRLASRNHVFNTVIDVGAAVGGWSASFAEAIPGKAHLLIEANSTHEPALSACCAVRRNWGYVLKACGRKPGQVFFDGSDPFGGVASDVATDSATQSVEVTSIDHEIGRLGLKGPFLIKLDTHGYEIPILEGASKTLRSTELLIIEVYNFKLHDGCLRFWEMCQWMYERGFAPIDLFDVLYRPKDGTLWQFDLVFAPNSSLPFARNTYQ